MEVKIKSAAQKIEIFRFISKTAKAKSPLTKPSELKLISFSSINLCVFKEIAMNKAWLQNNKIPQKKGVYISSVTYYNITMR